MKPRSPKSRPRRPEHGRSGPRPRTRSHPPAPGEHEPRRSAPIAREPDVNRGPEPPRATQVPTSVQTVAVTPDEAGMRVDRFLEAKFPGLSFSHIQRVIRKGELRVNGKRVDGKDRLSAGQSVRIPPLRLEAKPAPGSEEDAKTRAFLKSITLYEDA